MCFSLTIIGGGKPLFKLSEVSEVVDKLISRKKIKTKNNYCKGLRLTCKGYVKIKPEGMEKISL